MKNTIETLLNKEVVGEWFEINYSDVDVDVIDDIKSAIEKNLPKILEFFNIKKLPEKITFNIFPNRESYRDLLEIENYEPWMTGRSGWGEGAPISMVSPKNIAPRSYEDGVTTAVYELAHKVTFIVFGYRKNSLRWIAEGIAELLAKRTANTKYINKSFEDKNYPKIEELTSNNNSSSKFQQMNGYLFSPIYVKYFISKYGRDKFFESYKNPNLLEEFIYPGFEEEAIESILAEASAKETKVKPQI